MKERLDFRFELPKGPDGPLVELSVRELEQMLLQSLDDPKANRTAALWQLAQFYKINKDHEKAVLRLRELLALLPDPESKAECVFTMGQTMEQVGDYRAAIRYYKEALLLELASTFTWYFIHNNLGFSLNTLGHITEGEAYCRIAIRIDPNRPNAHKNLGLSLLGQGRHREAAEAFIAATQANAADNRAFHLLERLLGEHPDLDYAFRDKLDCCREAVRLAEQEAQERAPKVYRGWKKNLVLWWSRLAAMIRPIIQGIWT